MRGFRNLADADLAFPAAGCVVVGPNGHGKTSLLEALLYPRVFRSFRGAADRELARFGADGFHVAVTLAGAGGTTVTAGYDARTRQKRVTLDGLEPPSLAGAVGRVRGVVLSPVDVSLVAGGPRERRRYLDVQLALTVHGYLDALGRYRRALAQRLRAGPRESEAFEAVLADTGAQIVAARAAWAAEAAAAYAERCAALGERGTAALQYRARTPGDAPALREALARSRDRDRALGQTTSGPHRDDLRLTLDGRDLRTWGSAGQQRTAALVLRLVEADTLAAGGAMPVIGLDDAFAELDAERCRRLGLVVDALAESGAQIVATVPREDEIPSMMMRLERWTMTDGVTGR